VSVKGDAVAGESRRLKLPEAWERDRQRGTAGRYALLAVKIAVLAWVVMHGLWVFYRGVRTGAVPWLPIGVTAGVVAVGAAIGALLAYPLVWASYDTAWPESMFRTSAVIGMSIAVLFQGAGAVLALGTLAACFPGAAGLMKRAARRSGAAGALLAVLAALGAAAALGGIVDLARAQWPRLFPDAPIGVPDAVATALPGLAGLAGSLLPAIMMLALMGVAIHLWTHSRRPAMRALLLAGLLLALVPGGAEASAGELLAGLAQAALTLALAVVVIRSVLGANPVAYALVAAALAVAPSAIALIRQPGAAYTGQGWVIAGVAAAAVALWLWRGRKAAPVQ
jgi:hypothetical protein